MPPQAVWWGWRGTMHRACRESLTPAQGFHTPCAGGAQRRRARCMDWRRSAISATRANFQRHRQVGLSMLRQPRMCRRFSRGGFAPLARARSLGMSLAIKWRGIPPRTASSRDTAHVTAALYRVSIAALWVMWPGCCCVPPAIPPCGGEPGARGGVGGAAGVRVDCNCCHHSAAPTSPPHVAGSRCSCARLLVIVPWRASNVAADHVSVPIAHCRLHRGPCRLAAFSTWSPTSI